MPVKLGQGVVFRPGTAFDERWAPNQFLSGFVTSIFGDDASIVVFPDAYEPFYEMRVKRDDSLSQDRTWTPAVGESQTMPEAPADGQIYGRRNQAWTPISGEDQGFIQCVIISDTQPSAALPGLAWFDTTINNFYIAEQDRWVEPGHVNPTEEVSVNIVPPFVSGIIDENELLTCSTGDWTSQPITFAYQWYQEATPIPSANTNTHVIVTADVGHNLTCAVTTTNRIGVSQPASSNIISVKPPANVVAPSLSGSILVGGLLACDPGSWQSSSTATFTYQWMRAGVAIAGQTTNSYTVVSGDFGLQISCVVTATNLIGPTSASSNAVTIAAVAIITPPVISGDLAVFSTITCSTGVWDGLPTSYAYQWKRDGVIIGGSISNNLTLALSDVNHSFSCVVTATNAIGSNSSTSNTVVVPVYTKFDPGSVNETTLESFNSIVDVRVRATGVTTTPGAGAKSIHSKTTGKWCFECDLTKIGGSNTGVGLLLSNTPSYLHMVSGTGCAVVFKNGQIWANEVYSGKTLGGLVNGDNLHFAVDLDNRRLWVQRNNGSWNGDPAAVPGSVGGISFAAGLIAPAVCFGGTGLVPDENILCNFGTVDTSFSVAGFVPGWLV